VRQALALVLPLGLAIANPAAAEATRTLRVQLQGDPAQPFAVENLAGTMSVVPGSGDTVVAVATVHAESDELAASMRFEQVRGEKGVPTLRVRYPVDRHSVYRYGGRAKDGGGGFLDWISGGGGNRLKYDDHRVSVSGSRGVVLYADVEIQVPRKVIDAHFRNHVGSISAQGVEGRVKFDTGSGDVTIRDAKGAIMADTGSGDVQASDVEGSFVCDTGSGECNVSGFKGDNLKCDTGSGTVRVDAASARRIAVDTGSGDVRVRAIDVEEFAADTGSGDVELAVEGSRLARVNADTGSGSVRLRLGPEASFEAHASTGSGDVVSRYRDAEAIVRGKEVVGYRRGDGRIRIDVETGSGDVVLEPR
jgi:hypothetical protein